MRKFLPYLFLIMLLGACRQQKNEVPSLSETFGKDDKKPFGAYVAYRHFKNLFNDRYVQPAIEPFDDSWRNIRAYSSTDKYSLYMIVTKNLYLTFSEADAMVNYVKEGNDLFISADYVDTELLELIGCKMERYDEVLSEVNGKMHDTWVQMFFGKDFNAKKYGYYYYPFLNSFYDYDSTSSRVLGVNEKGQPDYIVLFLGNGRLYLHTAPRTFGNYFLLSGDNHLYLENVLSYLRFDPKRIYWDDYYHKKTYRKHDDGSSSGGSDEGFSSFNVINKNPPLRWAFWLAVIAIVLYVLFNIKRRQRVIREIDPNVNTTVAFTETVGRLYLQKKDNKNISEKIITYFYEHVRNKYFLNTTHVNDEFINNLAGKSGVPPETTQKLFNTISKIRSAEKVSDMDLLSLNQQIENFLKNKT